MCHVGGEGSVSGQEGDRQRKSKRESGKGGEKESSRKVPHKGQKPAITVHSVISLGAEQS